MHKKFFAHHFDLVTPDGKVTHRKKIDSNTLEVTVLIQEISQEFVGFQIDKNRIFFNLKSTLAQLGLHSNDLHIELTPKHNSATIDLRIYALNSLGKILLEHISIGAFIGKLFAADDRRCVRTPAYLSRMFGRTDRNGSPLLTLGGIDGKEELQLKIIDGRTVAFLPLLQGHILYDAAIQGFLPTVAKALECPELETRNFLKLHQTLKNEAPCYVKKNQLLLAKTHPLHIRTVYGRIVNDLLPSGVSHTSASILQPDTKASGDIYELFGESKDELREIPVEFYTLEPYREFVFFEDRDQLQNCIEDKKTLFKAMKTAPLPENLKCAAFIAKGEQLLNLRSKDWAAKVSTDGFIQNDPMYAFLEAMEDGTITSQGILLTRYLPAPFIKHLLINEQVIDLLKGIYFEKGSFDNGRFFSYEEELLLCDLAKYHIPVFWLNPSSNALLKYTPKSQKKSGMFVPLNQSKTFTQATFIGVYGSNAAIKDATFFLQELLKGLTKLKKDVNHPLLNPNTPLAVITNSSQETMNIGNKIAKDLNVLSCSNISSSKSLLEVNPHVDAIMPYLKDQFIERKIEPNCDLPIFFIGEMETDFDLLIEELRRQKELPSQTPVLLFGNSKYWKEKISLRSLSNSFYIVQTTQDALKIYRDFFGEC